MGEGRERVSEGRECSNDRRPDRSSCVAADDLECTVNSNPFSSDWLSADRDERLRPQRGLSYVAGPGDDLLRFITIPALLDEAVAAWGGRDAAIFAATGTRWSWYDLQRKADEVAAGLLALGIKRGDRVGIWAPNCEEWLGGAVRDGPHWRDPRQHQPRVSRIGTGIRAEPGSVPGAGDGSRPQIQRLRGDSARTRTGDRPNARRRPVALRTTAPAAPCGADR